MKSIDCCIVAVYFAFVLWAGWRYRQRNRTMDDFLLGGRRMRSLPVALSLFVSWFSIISYTAIPGELIQHGPMIWSGLLAAPVALWFVGWKVIPRMRRFYLMGIGQLRQVVSGYQIVDFHFGQPTARLASTLFLLMRIAWMAMIVHIASTVIVAPMAAVGPWLVAVVLIGVTVAYSLGGFKAVVLTDCIQAAIMFGGAIAIVCLYGGVSWPTEWPTSWPAPSLASPWERAGVFPAMLGAFCLGVCVKTGDQMNVQRFLAVPNIRASRRVLLLGFGFDILLTGLLALVGLSLLASHGAVPDADEVLPHFVASGLPFGITGLVVAALLAAAMSSVSSGLNACVSTVVSDWMPHHLGYGCSESKSCQEVGNIAPGWLPCSVITAVVGIIVFILSQVIGIVEGNLIELCYKVVNLLATPLGGLVLTALFLPRAKVAAVWLGCFGCLAVVVYVTYLSSITFLLASPLGLVVQLIIGGLSHGPSQKR